MKDYILINDDGKYVVFTTLNLNDAKIFARKMAMDFKQNVGLYPKGEMIVEFNSYGEDVNAN